jgi:uncharacterized protein YbjT (DUF2867 family)
MDALILGATGMVGQGVLRECLLDPDVKRVVTLGRSATGQHHGKLREIVRADLMNVLGYEAELARFDACFFCLGVSAVGLTEERYARVTYDLTLAVANTLARLNPAMTFIYVSGMGTDSSEQGRTMWARVKGRTENALLKLSFKAYMFRPGIIVPLHGIKSRTTVYRVAYALLKPVLPLMKKLFPAAVTTTEQLGRAMLAVARKGYPKRILENRDIATFA